MRSATKAAAEEAKTSALQQTRRLQAVAEEEKRQKLLELWDHQQRLVEKRKSERDEAAKTVSKQMGMCRIQLQMGSMKVDDCCSQ